MRLGEHDIRTTKDGDHKDVRVAHYEKHEGFSGALKIHDIAIVYLVKDVSFNGGSNITRI